MNEDNGRQPSTRVHSLPRTSASNLVPDWLCSQSVQPPLSLRSFALSVTHNSPLPHVRASTCSHPLPSSSIDLSSPSNKYTSQKSFPSIAVRLAAQQPTTIGPPARQMPSQHEPPTFNQILSSISKNGFELAQEEKLGKGVCIEASVYDGEAPTKSAHFRLPLDANLTELVDAIQCTSDIIGNKEMSTRETGAVLYVDGVLYEDRRFGSTDYASNITAFLEKQGVQVRVININDTPITFLHLTVQFGAPYVYMHRGNCEHLVVFTNVYKVYTADSAMKVLWRKAPRIIACDVCHAHYAEKFTFGDRVAGRSPFHFCGRCYEVGHYAQSGELFKGLEDIRVYSHPSPL